MKLVLIAVCLLSTFAGYAQEDGDVAQVLSAYTAVGRENFPVRRPLAARRIVSFPFRVPLMFYKRYTSEQLSAACQFHPSCSQFCKESMEECGVIKTLFLTADRLTRCNGAATVESPNYLMLDDKMHVEDRPDMYRFRRQ